MYGAAMSRVCRGAAGLALGLVLSSTCVSAQVSSARPSRTAAAAASSPPAGASTDPLPAMMAARDKATLSGSTYIPKEDVDISGEWGSRLHEDIGYRGTGPELGDYTGFPLNDAGRQQAESWDAEQLSSIEEQTKPHPVQYDMRGPGTNLRITKVFDPYNSALIGYLVTGTYGRADRMIWMDGRPHPSVHAEHLWQGYSTGRIVRNMLVVTTTHMKTGWVERNYAPSSNQATMTEYFVRHGNLLDMVSVLDDPVYLEEPLVRSQSWILTPNLGVDSRMQFEAVEEEAGRPDDYVPHYPLGTHHDAFAREFGLPFEATAGGSHTIYPDYLDRLRDLIAGRQPAPLNWAIPQYAPASGPTDDRDPAYCAGLDMKRAMVLLDQAHGAQAPCGTGLTSSESQDGVETLEVRPNLYMLVARGVNVTVQVGDDGVLVVDTGAAGTSAALLRAIRRLSSRPIRYIVETNFDGDAVGGAAGLVQAGGPRTAAASYGPYPGDIASGAAVIAQDAVNVRLAQASAGVPESAMPSSTFSARKGLYFNGEPIALFSAPAANADASSFAFFRKSDVISAGGLLDTERYPVIDRNAGGTLQGIIDGLTRIIETAIPERNEMGGTLVIPRRGWICNRIDVYEYRQMLTIIRDRIRDMVTRHMTLAQVKAARPTLDYDGIYGAQTGPWTTGMFIEAVYQEELAGAKKGTKYR
jgi:glyoxylase-like metal-dependent hydrolase (beta-lactamase superfamily II)